VAEREVRYARSSDGTSVAYCEWGVGPPLLLLPSFVSFAHGAWGLDPLIHELASSFTLVTYDIRGMGLSDRGITDFSAEARLADLRAVVDDVGIKRFSIVARLYEVPTAIGFAASWPDRVDRMVLLSPYADGRKFYESTDFGQLAEALHDVTVKQWKFVSETIIARGARPDTPPHALEERARNMREDWTPEALLAFRSANQSTDVTGLMLAVKAPTLVVAGQGDPAMQFSREVTSGIPNARLITPSITWDNISEEGRRQLLAFLGATSEPDSQTDPVQPSTLRAVLFTDLVGHTEMMSRLGDDRGRDVLREHERITREVLKANGGTEVKTMGDGFMASFGSVTRAVECALALQRAVETWNQQTDKPTTFRCASA
jgi:pimeloyl-ACP methyl ester carboxylesterase